MPCAFDDDVMAVANRHPTILHPAKGWWALPLQVVIISAVLVAAIQWAKPDPIPVHKDGSIRATKVQP